MKNISFMRDGKEFKPTRAELERVLDDYAERLAISEKALELACKKVRFECREDEWLEGKVTFTEEYFITKAKEMMKK